VRPTGFGRGRALPGAAPDLARSRQALTRSCAGAGQVPIMRPVTAQPAAQPAAAASDKKKKKTGSGGGSGGGRPFPKKSAPAEVTAVSCWSRRAPTSARRRLQRRETMAAAPWSPKRCAPTTGATPSARASPSPSAATPSSSRF